MHHTRLRISFSNSEAPGGGVAGLPFYQQFGRSVATSMWDGYLSSSFNSMQVAVNKNFSKGLLVKAAYTWSKAIDYADDDGWHRTAGCNQQLLCHVECSEGHLTLSHFFFLFDGLRCHVSSLYSMSVSGGLSLVYSQHEMQFELGSFP